MRLRKRLSERVKKTEGPGGRSTWAEDIPIELEL